MEKKIDIDKDTLLKLLNDFKEAKKEIIMIGYLKIENGMYIFDKIYKIDSIGNKNYLIFDPVNQIKFLKDCLQKKRTPIVIHNHLYQEDINFSDPDLSFFRKLSICYQKIGGDGIIFALLIHIPTQTIKYMKVGPYHA